MDDLAHNLRLLCSYGRSTSDVCRKAGINRQQFSKYLNGHARPSLSTLRKLCDFFGVDEAEIFRDAAAFRDLVRLRPPRFEARESHYDRVMAHLAKEGPMGRDLLARHEGYYHAYMESHPQQGVVIRALTHLYAREGKWFVKTIERFQADQFMLPATLKYEGYVTEGSGRICVHERERGGGRSLATTLLYPSEYATPLFLAGVLVGFAPEGAQDITCARTVWQYLGKKPDLRAALGQCGVIDPDQEDLPDFVRNGIGNDLRENEVAFAPRY